MDNQVKFRSESPLKDSLGTEIARVVHDMNYEPHNSVLIKVGQIHMNVSEALALKEWLGKVLP